MTKKLKRVFTLSILLNIILLGMFSGHAYHKYSSKMSRHHAERLSGFIDTTSLPAQKRESLKLALQDIKPPKRSERQKHEEEIEEILVAETFNKEEFQANIRKKHEHFKRRHEDMLEIIADIAENLNREERMELSSIMRSNKRRRK
jgi:Spy/CpxP family protein refolding chaperone